MIELIHPTDDSHLGFSAHLEDEADTEYAGAALAPALQSGLVIHLDGNLGAGKTTLVRGALRALGYLEKVKSPTYTLIEPYIVSRLHLYHFDFYRFTVPEEYLEAGLDEYFDGRGVCLVEWAEKAEPYVCRPDVVVKLGVSGAGRALDVTALTEAGRSCTEKMKTNLMRDTR